MVRLDEFLEVIEQLWRIFDTDLITAHRIVPIGMRKINYVQEWKSWSQGPVYNFSLFTIFITAMALNHLSALKNVLAVESALL